MASARVHLRLYNLIVEVELEGAVYPDQITDMSNRALSVFQLALTSAKEAGVDICQVSLEDYEDDD